MRFRRSNEQGRYPWERSQRRFRQSAYEGGYSAELRQARPGERGFGWARRRDVNDAASQQAAPHGAGRYDRTGEEQYSAGLREYEERAGYARGPGRDQWELDEGGVQFGPHRRGRAGEPYGEMGGRFSEAEYGPRRRYAGGYGGAGGEYARGGVPGYPREADLYGGGFSSGGGMWRRSGAAGGDYRETYGPAAGVGQYRGRGPKGYRRSDERIREDVCDRLTDDEDIDASEIEVAVESGVVTLNGSVDSREDKRRAEDVAETVTGVREVQNHLRLHDRQSGPFGEQHTEQSSGSSKR